MPERLLTVYCVQCGTLEQERWRTFYGARTGTVLKSHLRANPTHAIIVGKTYTRFDLKERK